MPVTACDMPLSPFPYTKGITLDMAINKLHFKISYKEMLKFNL